MRWITEEGHDVGKLPKWAQVELENRNAQIAELKWKLNQLTPTIELEKLTLEYVRLRKEMFDAEKELDMSSINPYRKTEMVDAYLAQSKAYGEMVKCAEEKLGIK